MTATATQPARTAVPAARQQTALPPEKVLHSGNAGLVIYRVGQFHYEFAQEGRGFSVDLLNYMNERQAGIATTFCYEERFGVRDRMHWFVHMKHPNDYRKLLDMVDHDEKIQDITMVDRLPEKGHGNWERIFVEGSIHERILVPQHGLNYHHDDGSGATYVPPARNQTSQPLDAQLDSANAGAIVVRSACVKYEFREEGRLFAFDWQEHVNRTLPGVATVLLYEENWGRQDRIYWLIHLREQADYDAVTALDRSPEMAELLAKQRVHESKGGGTWEQLFIPTTIEDRLLLPAVPSSAR
jgi:hypothetical protein